ncbi:GlsB/YeaQ/YmgE family stress response membrane protein [Sphingomonas panacisoli]|uniref:GlsB/YeaQ/YmgE family stress response membrane protein n=1 Tax=Sphingomonas panacisoli TaxID=1813879 RepID=A0A5B8LLC3_9SPHN|nr:GlsB/YeaQ/YmgE family stress response membrane protein [Sphingomonas panacisoli]QDZ08739.1 GlsB/YeaQ/YmgE family stress response membrane protein [Sphingomonas panacisoli]
MPERSILAWLAIGLVVGVIGKLTAPGRKPGGWMAIILTGIAGALLAGFVAETMRWTTTGTWRNDAAASLGAIAALAVHRWLKNRQSR